MNLISKISTWYDSRKTAKELNALSDDMLHDIGLERSEIRNTVMKYENHKSPFVVPGHAGLSMTPVRGLWGAYAA